MPTTLHRLHPRDVAEQLMREFPKEPHEALKRLRAISGANAIPETYWSRVERAISALATRKRLANRTAFLCTCRTDGKRDCPEHGGGNADD